MTQKSSNSIGLFGVFLVVFVVLKLTKTIDWTWTWVLSPLWLPLAVGLLFGCITVLLQYLTRPKTPAEKAAAACRRMADAIRDQNTR